MNDWTTTPQWTISPITSIHLGLWDDFESIDILSIISIQAFKNIDIIDIEFFIKVAPLEQKQEKMKNRNAFANDEGWETWERWRRNDE